MGGAACSLGYNSNTKTNDIDVYRVIRGDTSALGHAAHEARDESGYGVAIGSATIADLPYDFETRIRQVSNLGLSNIRIFVPDKYDISLSKICRGYSHDLEAVLGIHRRHKLSQKVLLDRFEKEFLHIANTNKRMLCISMFLAVSQLYGRIEGERFASKYEISLP